MHTLSLILLSLHLPALSTTVVAFQSILWYVVIQRTAYLTSPVLTALLCSVILIFSGLPISLILTSHCAQGVWYTTLLFICFCGPFTLVSRLLKVLLCWNKGCTPSFLQMFPSLSEVPLTYSNTHKVILPGSTSCCVFSCSLLGFITPVMTPLGYLFLRKAILRCSSSASKSSLSQILVALLLKHWITPRFTLSWWIDEKWM